jgi:parallel beta-helix repeat protein
MNHKKLFLTATFAFVAIFLFGSQQTVSAVQRTVDDDFAECPGAGFTSIQAAVNASNSGDSVRVCPGTYTERVTIPNTKNNLTLFSAMGSAVIKAPAAVGVEPPYAIVLINGAQGVVFRGFSVSGPLPDALFCSTDIRAGISVIGGGSATIRNNVITQIRSTSPALRGCQNGFGITVGRNSTGQSGSAVILGNVIQTYQKGGIFVDGTGSSATIDNNDIRGIGPTPDIAQNGIQVSRSATADVRNNKVEENRYSPQTTGGSGIIIFQSGGVRVFNNEVNRNDFGILFDTESNPRASQNLTTYNSFDGISLYTTTGALIEWNSSYVNGFDGIYVYSDSTGNLIRRNEMLFNTAFDAEDISNGTGTGGTANTWTRNRCDTDNRGGALCTNEANAGRDTSPVLLGNNRGTLLVTRPRAARRSIAR